MAPARKSTRSIGSNGAASVFPGQLHIGDRFTDANEWEVVSRPAWFTLWLDSWRGVGRVIVGMG